MAFVFLVLRRATMKQLIFGSIVLFLASIAAAQVNTHLKLVTGNSFSGYTVEGATKIDVSTAKSLHDRGVRFIDARFEGDWKKSHIPGASNLIAAWVTEEALMKIVGKDEEVVFYCDGADCSASPYACAKALSLGYEKVYYFAEGYPGWEAAGHPIEIAK
jgi:rhodanese-related sulfurtransferase